ncbi:hypothetical protein P167DRAFT_565266 [Morchella conica CCBAS932]|uniref:Uncharacterized protein n=1 Tax=Morchella conica CCBAS932 TaxID=1392247 RepID=A0A3N4KVC4_9PEZI|nr:hypothetical protein P167DRAFT_565266 [Morchella conica CCBAS932]
MAERSDKSLFFPIKWSWHSFTLRQLALILALLFARRSQDRTYHSSISVASPQLHPEHWSIRTSQDTARSQQKHDEHPRNQNRTKSRPNSRHQEKTLKKPETLFPLYQALSKILAIQLHRLTPHLHSQIQHPSHHDLLKVLIIVLHHHIAQRIEASNPDAQRVLLVAPAFAGVEGVEVVEETADGAETVEGGFYAPGDVGDGDWGAGIVALDGSEALDPGFGIFPDVVLMVANQAFMSARVDYHTKRKTKSYLTMIKLGGRFENQRSLIAIDGLVFTSFEWVKPL